MESNPPRAGQRRQRDGKQVQPRPTATPPPVAAKPEKKKKQPEEEIIIQVKHPKHFSPGQVMIINGSEVDVSVDTEMQDLQDFLSELERDEHLTLLCIHNFLNHRPRQDLVDALLTVALNNQNIQQVVIFGCLIGLEILASVVIKKQVISLTNCRCDQDLSLPEKRDYLVSHWGSNRSLQKVQIHQTFDTDFLGALFHSLADKLNLYRVDIGITNSTAASYLAKFLLDAPGKRRIEITLDESRFDAATVHRLLGGLSKTKFIVILVLKSCCWKARPKTTAQEAHDLYETFMAGLKHVKVKTCEKLKAALEEDSQGGIHTHADIPPFEAELERGHDESRGDDEFHTQPPAVTNATAQTKQQQQQQVRGKKKGKGRK